MLDIAFTRIKERISHSFKLNALPKDQVWDSSNLNYPKLILEYVKVCLKMNDKLPKNIHYNPDYVTAIVLNEIELYNQNYYDTRIAIKSHSERSTDVYIFHEFIWYKLKSDEITQLLNILADALHVERLYKHKLISILNKTLYQISFIKPDRSLTKVAVQNGIYDFEAMEFFPFVKENEKEKSKSNLKYEMFYNFGLINKMNYSYNIDDKTRKDRIENSKFIKYMNEILKEGEDDSKIKIIQEYLGWSICRLPYKIEKIAFFIGRGGNGKSVLFEIIEDLLGEDNMSTVPLAKLLANEDKVSHLIENSIINYCSEIGTFNRNHDLEKFKRLASGEPIEIKRNYQDIYSIKNYARFIVNGQRLPPILEFNEAWFRRFLIINFNKTFKSAEKNVNLKQEIVDEGLDIVLDWIIEGAKNLRHRIINKDYLTDKKHLSSYVFPFYYSEESDEAVKDYKRQYSSIYSFISKCLINTNDKFYGKNDFSNSDEELLINILFKRYKEFCIIRDLKITNSIHAFENALIDEGFTFKREQAEIVSINALVKK